MLYQDLAKPQTRTSVVSSQRAHLVFVSYCPSFSSYCFKNLHYLKPRPILRCQCIFVWFEENGPCPVEARSRPGFKDTSRRSGAGPASLISVAPEEERNAELILRRHLWYIKRLGVGGKRVPPGRNRGPDELVAILCKHAL